MKYRKKLHPKQIPTKMYVVKQEMIDQSYRAVNALLNCLSGKAGSNVQKNDMLIAAVYFERISCPVYLRKDGSVHKPAMKTYYKQIFESWAETPEEISGRIVTRGVTHEDAKHIHKLVWQVADLVCPMMACDDEQMSVGEYAYAIEYVIRHDGDLPKPEINHIFPTNYPDYEYTKGIAEEVRKLIE